MLQKMAQSGKFDALIAIGAVVRGDTYHFEIVCNESARGILDVQLETGVPIANVILTVGTEEQAHARMAEKGRDDARVAVEMANLLKRICYPLMELLAIRLSPQAGKSLVIPRPPPRG